MSKQNSKALSNDDFPLRLNLRIDWSELDYFGHVNNVAFYKYIQASRVNYWDKIGLTQSHLDTNIGPMLASCTCDFIKPLFYPGEVSILARLKFIGNTSFGFEHRILDQDGNLAAEASDIMVMFDFNENKKVEFPNELRIQFERIEKGSLD